MKNMEKRRPGNGLPRQLFSNALVGVETKLERSLECVISVGRHFYRLFNELVRRFCACMSQFVSKPAPPAIHVHVHILRNTTGLRDYVYASYTCC